MRGIIALEMLVTDDLLEDVAIACDRAAIDEDENGAHERAGHLRAFARTLRKEVVRKLMEQGS